MFGMGDLVFELFLLSFQVGRALSITERAVHGNNDVVNGRISSTFHSAITGSLLLRHLFGGKRNLPDKVMLECMRKSSNYDLILALDERELEQSGYFCASGVQADFRYLAGFCRYQRDRVHLSIGCVGVGAQKGVRTGH